MKLLSAIVLVSVVAVSDTVIARLVKTSDPTVAKKSITHRCQQGKHVTVTYGSNRQGLTTSISAVVDGRRRLTPIDLDHSGNADTYYGKKGGYVLSTVYVDKKTYRKQSIMIIVPDGEIVLKDCSPH